MVEAHQRKRFAKDTDSRLLFGRGYYVDFDQFARLLTFINDQSGRPIENSKLSEAMGLADSKAAGILGLARGFRLVERGAVRLTDLGRCILRYDKFFDDTGTLWFLHYVVSSEPRQLVWNRFVNAIVPARRIFTMQQFREALSDQINTHTEYTAVRHVQKETLTVIHAYTETNFARLAYLRADGNGYMLGHREQVSALVLAGSIACFRDRHRPGDTAIPVTDLLTAPNSPGIVFQLDEAKMRAALEELKMQPNISLESRADLDQVRLTENTPDYTWMERYYVSR